MTSVIPQALACEHLSLQRGRRRVLQDVSAMFSAGELTAVIGPNGAGKSSLLACLAGVLSPSAGTVYLDGRNAAEVSAAARARTCSYLPQAEFPAWSMSSADLVALGLLPWGRVRDRSHRVHAALAQVDALHLAERAVTELSGGELRRVQLARLLVGEAPLLLADEPGAALDIRHQLQLMDTFRHQADAGKAVVVAVHDLALAARYCDRILLLENGCLRAQGAPADVLTQAQVSDVYGIRSEFRWRDGRPEFVTGDLL